MDNKFSIIKRCVIILMSSFLSAIAVNVFFIPHKLLSGGIGGISLIIQYLTSIPAGYFIFLLNIPLLILSFKEIDLEFTLLTMLGTFSQALFQIITKDLGNTFMLNDIMLSCIYGGVLHGIALGLIFSNHGSLGGSDIPSIILKRRYNYDVGKVSFVINLFIISIGAAFFGIVTGLYTLISMYLVTYVLDRVINGFGKTKLLFIITNKEEEITSSIKGELNRSATVLTGEGSYTKNEVKIIYCVISLRQVPKLRHIIEKADPYSFTSIIDASEVHGRGFKDVL